MERINHMEYMEGMEKIPEDIMEEVIARMEAYDYDQYTEADVRRALDSSPLALKDFAVLLSPAAMPFLEDMAKRAREETRKHFGNSVYIFTPIYISNYCENHCVYCGFNCHNRIRRVKLDLDRIEAEMKAISETGLEEILILTGESPAMSDVAYIGEACKIARRYFRMVGLEIYPVNTEEYAYLHDCGADFVTVFQETYNSEKYETLHLETHIPVPLPCTGEGSQGRDEGRCLCSTSRTRRLQEGRLCNGHACASHPEEISPCRNLHIMSETLPHHQQ